MEKSYTLSVQGILILHIKCVVTCEQIYLIPTYIHTHGCISKSLSLICGVHKISNHCICRLVATSKPTGRDNHC